MRLIETQLSNVDKGSATPISRNVINYYANTRGRQYVMLPGSLTSRIGRNIFFSLSDVAIISMDAFCAVNRAVSTSAEGHGV